MSSTGVLATVLVPVGTGIALMSADAWRRARRNDDQLDDVEDKLDVILVSLGIDPEDPPTYQVDVAQNGGDKHVRSDDD